MAGNGGIIGPVNTVVAGKCLSAKTTAITASGTFVVQCAACGGARTGSVLVVAGGGSGGSQSSGGGGAGGLRLLNCQSLPTSPITVTIGAGGVGTGVTPVSPVESPGRQGCASVFAATPNPITSTGGGGGVHQLTNVCTGEGGSGGGGTNASPGPEILANGNTPPTSPSQGNPGGTGQGGPLGCNGGGGGGAGAVGTNATGPAAGGGGAGFDVTPVFGSSPQPFYNPFNGIYAGGGGGAYDSRNASSPGAGGPGGGSAGVGPGTSASAAVNSGSGSGGGNYGPGGTGNSGNGGSGVILVKECAVSIPATAPGIWSLNTVYDFVKNDNWV
tara:strand:+ start:8 stop:994 length:987 start_codon:yes stop_codon:yes gene_type:complete